MQKNILIIVLFFSFIFSSFAQTFQEQINTLDKAIEKMERNNSISTFRGLGDVWISGFKTINGFEFTLEKGKDNFSLSKDGNVVVFNKNNKIIKDTMIIKKFLADNDKNIKDILSGKGKSWVSSTSKIKKVFKTFKRDERETEVDFLTKIVNRVEFKKLYDQFLNSKLGTNPEVGIIKETGKYLKNLLDDDYSNREWRKFNWKLFVLFNKQNYLPVELAKKDQDANAFLIFLEKVQLKLKQNSPVWRKALQQI